MYVGIERYRVCVFVGTYGSTGQSCHPSATTGRRSTDRAVVGGSDERLHHVFDGPRRPSGGKRRSERAVPVQTLRGPTERWTDLKKKSKVVQRQKRRELASRRRCRLRDQTVATCTYSVRDGRNQHFVVLSPFENPSEVSFPPRSNEITPSGKTR